jgi:hypothetical protein
MESKIEDAKLEYAEPTKEDRELIDKLHYDLFAVERELVKHGSSVKSLLANVARHSLGVVIVVPDKPVDAE